MPQLNLSKSSHRTSTKLKMPYLLNLDTREISEYHGPPKEPFKWFSVILECTHKSVRGLMNGQKIIVQTKDDARDIEAPRIIPGSPCPIIF